MKFERGLQWVFSSRFTFIIMFLSAFSFPHFQSVRTYFPLHPLPVLPLVLICVTHVCHPCSFAESLGHREQENTYCGISI